MKLNRRRYRCEDDYWAIRAFLREVYLLHDRRAVCWPVQRWDYWRWHVNANRLHLSLEAAVFLWETMDGRLAAVLHPDGPDGACLQVHPALRSAELEVEMIATAETQFTTVQPDGSQRLVLWADEHDDLRQNLLTRRGYAIGPCPEFQRRRALTTPLPEVRLAAGYTLRSLGDETELPARSRLARHILLPGEPEDHDPDWAWYRSVQRAPLYRRDLDLVAVAPDGELAACATVWFDDVTRSAALEPVGVHPNYQRPGLDTALVAEGLRRAARLGATLAIAESTAATDALYTAAGFVDCERREPWIRHVG